MWPEKFKKGGVLESTRIVAQGVAYSYKKLNGDGGEFSPVITPKQTVKLTKMCGERFVEIQLVGDSFEECAEAALKYCAENHTTFIPPYDNYTIIEG